MISWKNHSLYQVDYQHWANEKLFDSCDMLNDSLRKQDAGLFYKSIHGTLNHLLLLKLLWLSKLKGEVSELRLEQVQHEEWRELKQQLRQAIRQAQHFLQVQPTDYFEGELRFHTQSGIERVYWAHELISQAMLSFAHQRGQVAAIATQLGAPSVELDYLSYRHEMQDSLAHMRQATVS